MKKFENKKDGFDGEVCVVVPPIVVKQNSLEKFLVIFTLQILVIFQKQGFITANEKKDVCNIF